MDQIIRIIVASLLFSICITTVGYLFYSEDIKNNLPTEIPKHIKPTHFGENTGIRSQKKLKLIHFFNPDCPCSKFNIKQIEELAANYGADVEFVAYSHTSIPAQFPIPVYLDKDKRMAIKMGVYSTPQAVLLDSEGKLLYRGNYNKARYCSNKETAFVQQAIINYLHDNNSQNLMLSSGKPYGCRIFNN